TRSPSRISPSIACSRRKGFFRSATGAPGSAPGRSGIRRSRPRSANRRIRSIRASRPTARRTSNKVPTLIGVELKRGDTAPAFSLEDDEGKTLSTKDLGGSRYVVYFYPKDDTPGCTTEACQFTENVPPGRSLLVEAQNGEAFRVGIALLLARLFHPALDELEAVRLDL